MISPGNGTTTTFVPVDDERIGVAADRSAQHRELVDDRTSDPAPGREPVVALAAPPGLRAKFTRRAEAGPRDDAADVIAFSAAGEALVLDHIDGRLHPISTYKAIHGYQFAHLFNHHRIAAPLAPAPAGLMVFFTDDRAPVPVAYFDARGRAVTLPQGSIAQNDGDYELMLVDYMENIAGVGFPQQLND
jgi:hypothetical protein